MSGIEIALQVGEEGFKPRLPLVPGGNIRSNAEHIDVAALVVIDCPVNLRSDLGVGGNNGSNAGPGQIEGLGGGGQDHRAQGIDALNLSRREITAAAKDKLAVNFVANEEHAGLVCDLSRPANFVGRPDTAHRIVRAAKKEHLHSGVGERLFERRKINRPAGIAH